MASWQFEKLSAALIEQEPTQRDQFNNDEVLLAEALVRESIQNSFDARQDEAQPAKVRFALTELDEPRATELAHYLKGTRRHLEASGLDPDPLDHVTARVLLIEDFNTSGLTGAVDDDDGGNFHSFWRRHGISPKTGRSGGRWGLGKLVFSSSSEIRAFFGLTIRTGETSPLLMGQAVLKNHKINGCKHPPHGFWCKEERGNDDIQMPEDDGQAIARFCQLVGIARSYEPGLSIIVPHASPDISEAGLLRAVVKHYYFPILAGALTIEVGSCTVSETNILEIAHSIPDMDIPLDFAGAVQAQRSNPPLVVAKNFIDVSGLTENNFSADDLTLLRNTFQKGELVHVEVPVRLSSKVQGQMVTKVLLFLQKSAANPTDSCALFIRGFLTVPGERRHFSGVPAYGALVASEPNIEAFLGDAENPAHTSWDPQTEKLKANWANAANALRGIRASLKTLYQLVAEEDDQQDEDALIDFFALVDQSPAAGARRKKTPRTVSPIEPRERFMIVQPRMGGFAITPGAAAASRTYPIKLRIRLAYDLLGANPFKRFSPFDFNLKRDIGIEADQATTELSAANVLVATLQSADFRIEASGFDANRDLIVEARLLP